MVLNSYNTGMGFFLFNSDTKSVFYQTFMEVLFKNLLEYCEAIIVNKETKTSLDNFLINTFTESMKSVDEDLKEKLIIPKMVQKQVNQWKLMLIDSLKKSIELITRDDLVESNYFKVYRILDLITAFVTIALSTGAITFNQMNGSFDKIPVDHILVKKDS